MSMLAEQRRKKKWVINPVKKPLWTTESNGIKFGRELMEKMGWTAGKGLGVKEQGIQEPLRVSYKNDTKGIGFKGNDEDWIEQQDEFNTLLSNLRSDVTADLETSEAKKPEATSLEEKSKHSRKRVHYQKFVRGKDLSKYSENDLASILGTNKAKKVKFESEVATETETNSSDKYEMSYGITTIKSGFIQDYFKKKRTSDKMKCEDSCKTNDGASENVSDNFADSKSHFSLNEDNENNENLSPERKHKKKKHKSKADDINSDTTENIHKGSDFSQTVDEIEEKKCKKRKHKSVSSEEQSGIQETFDLNENESKTEEACFEGEPKVKKRKKNKDNLNEDKIQTLDVEKSVRLGDDRSLLVMSDENSKTVKPEEKKSKKKRHKLKCEPEPLEGKEVEINETNVLQEENNKEHKHKNKAVDLIEKKHKVKRKRSDSNEREFENQIKQVDDNEKGQEVCREQSTGLIRKEYEGMSEVTEKKHKRKKHKSELDREVDSGPSEGPCKSEEELSFVLDAEENEIEGKKAKEKKHKAKSESKKEDTKACEADGLESSGKRKKGKKKREKSAFSEGEVLDETEKTVSSENDKIPFSVSSNCEEFETSVPENENVVNSSYKKKKKRRKEKEKSEIFEGDECLQENLEKKEKKKKANLKEGNNEDIPLDEQNEKIGKLHLNGTDSELNEGIKVREKKNGGKEKQDSKNADETSEMETEIPRKKKKDSKNADETSETETEIPRKRTKGEKSEKVTEKVEEWSVEKGYVEKRVGISESDSKKGNKVKGMRVSESNLRRGSNLKGVRGGVESVGKPPVSQSGLAESVQNRTYTKQKVLDLICWADIEEFRGSNLGNVLGYGFKKEYLNSNKMR